MSEIASINDITARQGGSAEKIILRRELNPELRPSLNDIERRAAVLREKAKTDRARAKFYAKAARLNNEIARLLNSKAALHEFGQEANNTETLLQDAMARLAEHEAKGYGDEVD